MRYALPLLLVLLGGCAQIKVFMTDYKEPVMGDTAMVRFSTNGDLMLIPDRNCTDWSAPDAGVVVAHKPFGGPKFNGRKIGMAGEAPAGFTSAEVKVPAGKPLTVVFKSEIMNYPWIYTCEGNFTFLPKPGEQYQMTVNHDTGANRCSYEPKLLSNPTHRVALYKTEACK